MMRDRTPGVEVELIEITVAVPEAAVADALNAPDVPAVVVSQPPITNAREFRVSVFISSITGLY